MAKFGSPIAPRPGSGGGMISIPSPNPKATKKPKATVQPIVPKAPKNTGTPPKAFPSPAPYSPIKQTKSVNKVYKTY
jgi:hypothetical protein